MANLSALYATALFDIFSETGNLDDSLDQAVFLRDTLNNDECRRIITHPHITVAEKRAFFKEIFASGIHDDLLGFLYLAVDKNREEYLVPALTEYIRRVKQHQGKTTANVVSATELSEKQITALEKLLSKKLNKQVEVSLKIDPTVVGGLYIQADSYFLDRTIKKQMLEMKDSIEKEYGE